MQTDSPTAALAFAFVGRAATLTLGTGPDHSVFDVYVGGGLWQSFDGYAAAPGTREIVLTVSDDGPHTVEIRNRRDRRPGATGYRLRFGGAVVANAAWTLRTLAYRCDALARLVTADEYAGVNTDAPAQRAYAYAYDRAGNRTQAALTVGGTTTTTDYSYNAANQLVSDGTHTLTYDANGNLTGNGTQTYAWDRANRLVGVGATSYTYDGVGNRMAQTAGGIVTRYLLDVQPGLVQRIAATRAGVTERYLHGMTGIHAMESSAGVWRYAVADGLGNVRAETDANGAVLGARSFTPYLEVEASDGTFGMPFAVTGEPTDFDLGLVYLRARDYAPGLGVFTARDPFEGTTERAMSLNGYSWVEGNVVNAVDPSGYTMLFPASQHVNSLNDLLRLNSVNTCGTGFVNGYQFATPGTTQHSLIDSLFLQSTSVGFISSKATTDELCDCYCSTRYPTQNDWLCTVCRSFAEGLAVGIDFELCKPRSCNISIASNPIVREDLGGVELGHHTFIIYTDELGRDFEYRAGQEGLLLYAETNPFNADSARDYEDFVASGNKRLLLLDGADACKKRRCLDTAISAINDMQLTYLVVTQNSNSFTSFALKLCDLPLVLPPYTWSAPGWGFGI